MAEMTDSDRIELAIRRVSTRLKDQQPLKSLSVTQALDMLADEIASMKPPAPFAFIPADLDEGLSPGASQWVKLER